MGLRALITQVASWADVSRALDSVRAALQALDDDKLGRTAIITDRKLTTSDTRVYHGLRRPARGWIVVGNNASAVVYEGAASGAPAEYVNLRASAAATVSLLFF